MARRKGSDGAGIVMMVFLAMAFAAFVAFGMLGPVALLLWWAISEFRAYPVRHVRNAIELGPTAIEQTDLSRQRSLLLIGQSKFAQADAAGDSGGIPRRSDGMFDGRSKRGRELNGQMEAAATEIALARHSLTEIETSIADRVNGWAERVASRLATRVGILTWFAMMASFWVVRPAWVHSIGSMVTDHPDNRVLFGASIAATGVALLVIIVVRGQYRRSLVSDPRLSGAMGDNSP